MKHNPELAEQLIKGLATSSLFKKVSADMLKELTRKMKISNHEAGITIINKDDEGYTMYFIMSGEVKIHDKEQLLAKLGKGEFFGEMSILDREPRSMSVTALVPSMTASIQRADFFSVLNRYPGMTVELIGFISRRLRKLNKFMVETDCPYLAPVPLRGKRAEPAHTKIVAETIANARGVSLEEIARATTATAEEFFRFNR